MQQPEKRRVLSIFSLVMISVIAVDSLRSLPISAEYGFSLTFYYLITGITFFIPTALVSAELATAWPKTGGIYVWVREAFGERIGFVTIWLQWIYNVCWFPTILAVIAATFAYLFNPDLVNDKFYLISTVLIIFWAATLISFFGMKLSSKLTNVATIIGTIMPMLFITLLGLIWMLSGRPIQISMSWGHFFPDFSHINNLVLLTAILYGLVGMELSAMHAQEAKNPERDYPKVMLIAGIIIICTLICGSMAVAIVVPHQDLSLVAGLLQAFTLFFKAFHLTWLMPIIAIMIIIGAIGGVSAWTIGPTKGMMVAAKDGALPPFFAKTNRYYAPVTMLFLQALIFTGLCAIFFLMPTINSSYWLLTNLTSQLALLVYVAMFAAVIRLRYKYPNQPRLFKIPGGKIGLWTTGLLGLCSSLFTIGIGFLPPAQFEVGAIVTYETILIVGILLAIIIPLFIYALRKPIWKRLKPLLD